MLVVAVPVSSPKTGTCRSRCTLELNVCLDSCGWLASTLEDVLTPHCKLLLDGEEAWSGRLGWDSGGWVVHSGMGDDEPVRRLWASTLRPGDHLTLGCPREGEVEFRVVQASRATAMQDG